MVAIMDNKFFEKSKEFFENGDLINSIEYYEKAIPYIDKKEKASYIQFLKKILEYCREKDLQEEEAVVLRCLGRTHSVFKHSFESLKYHEESLRIQRKLGKKTNLAEGLVFLAEDLEVSGNYKKCLKIYNDAAEIFHELGKLRKEKDIKKEISRLDAFSKEMVEDEYIMNKFHVDKY